jgi:calcium-dependent protein kinase
MLLREMEILLTLDHPNVIKFYEIYEDERYFYIVQEYCAGGELLQRVIRQKHLSEVDTARIIKKVMHAVNHMHFKGVVHRDLKPENILFATHYPDSELKIIDFGLSNKFSKDEKSTLKTMVGTPLYVSPQVCIFKILSYLINK